MPAFSSIELLAVRSDMIEEAGLVYPKTFSDVLKVGRELHAPRRGRFGVAWNARRGMPLASSFAFLLACCGGAVLRLPRGRSDWSLATSIRAKSRWASTATRDALRWNT